MKKGFAYLLAGFAGLLAVGGSAQAEPAVTQLRIQPSSFERASEALQDAIENQGLIPGVPSHFGAMLERTGPVLGHAAPVYGQAEVIPFCSATISWGLVRENPDFIALCPLTIALYTLAGKPETVYLSYREPGSGSAALRAATRLLQEIAAATASSARMAGSSGGNQAGASTSTRAIDQLAPPPAAATRATP